jgi:hypothetical protein
MIGDIDIFRSITYFMIVSDIDGGLIVAKYVALVTGILSSLRAFVNQIYCFVASASTIYSASYIEVHH